MKLITLIILLVVSAALVAGVVLAVLAYQKQQAEKFTGFVSESSVKNLGEVSYDTPFVVEQSPAYITDFSKL